MWDRFFEDNDTESEEEESAAGDEEEEEKAAQHKQFKPLNEKKLSQNNGPLNFRKLREYIPLADESGVSSSEETFGWFEPEKHESESYFAMINLNRRDLVPDE